MAPSVPCGLWGRPVTFSGMGVSQRRSFPGYGLASLKKKLRECFVARSGPQNHVPESDVEGESHAVSWIPNTQTTRGERMIPNGIRQPSRDILEPPLLLNPRVFHHRLSRRECIPMLYSKAIETKFHCLDPVIYTTYKIGNCTFTVITDEVFSCNCD